MAITLDATVGGTDSNSYVTLDEADTYFLSRANSSEWSNITDDEVKKSLLISATDRVSLEKFDGFLSNTSQALTFPRTDLPLIDGRDVDNIIPKTIKRAVYELAIHMVSVDISKPDLNDLPIEQLSVGSISLKYKIDKNDNASHSSQDLPPLVLYLLDDLSYTAGNGAMTIYR
ncbi:MAG: DnaT-like ssDNA-binding protein [Campylobacterota bacterium]|nr:DnaT-like ssDNA-binding protein [Campylobacterota bacterium]